ncbi:Hypothetical protein A7982_00317 [Minicystis rosea]|nr:Hypothetical protein A7982_00317 [Minicystis rosea]
MLAPIVRPSCVEGRNPARVLTVIAALRTRAVPVRVLDLRTSP